MDLKVLQAATPRHTLWYGFQRVIQVDGHCADVRHVGQKFKVGHAAMNANLERAQHVQLVDPDGRIGVLDYHQAQYPVVLGWYRAVASVRANPLCHGVKMTRKYLFQ